MLTFYIPKYQVMMQPLFQCGRDGEIEAEAQVNAILKICNLSRKKSLSEVVRLSMVPGEGEHA